MGPLKCRVENLKVSDQLNILVNLLFSPQYLLNDNFRLPRNFGLSNKLQSSSSNNSISNRNSYQTGQICAKLEKRLMRLIVIRECLINAFSSLHNKLASNRHPYNKSKRTKTSIVLLKTV